MERSQEGGITQWGKLNWRVSLEVIWERRKQNLWPFRGINNGIFGAGSPNLGGKNEVFGEEWPNLKGWGKERRVPIKLGSF